MYFRKLCTLPALFSLALANIGDVCRSSAGSGTCKAESSCSTGFTVTNACPNDPTNVKCCIQASCKDNSGQCLDKSRVACTGGVFKADLCPGGDNVQCCQKATTEPKPPSSPAPKPTDIFVAYIRRIYNLAKQYGGDRPANQLVMEWLRHSEYNSLEWKALIRGVDDDFTTFVQKAGVTPLAGFLDPEYNIDVKASHLGACMNGVFLKGQASGTDTNRADVTGWGGDWMTFYGEWRRDHDKQPKGGKYCLDHMCNAVDDTTFKLRDLIEDADCYNIGMRLRANPGLSIADELEKTFAGGYQSRMKDFIGGRFGDRSKAQAVAKSMLLPGDDVIVNAGRIRLVQQQGGFLVKLPLWLSDEDMDDLTKGFADRLFGIVELEDLASQ
ncbi:MAG: hypothetical protein LQ352_006570 [Teloschistes flavicans]|nr:MAG: hypothetical protein LQ352_006570 [Teloschistes flavicans]